ncbi:MAG: hypothetical protein ACREAA_11465 [Candidatus Polarisedimenticolia bacterium]
MRRALQRPSRAPRAFVDGSQSLAAAIRRRLEMSGRCELRDRIDGPLDVMVICDDGEPADALAARVRAVALSAARACPTTAFVLAADHGLSLCLEAARASGVPPWLVLATGAMPRAAAEAARLAARLGVAPGQVSIPVIGGDSSGPHAGQVPLTRYANAAGIPARALQAGREEELKATGRSGGSSAAALAAAGASLALAVLGDSRRVACCGGWTEGFFGLPGGFVSLPFPVGARGVEDPLPLRLTLDERALLQRVAARW